MDSRQKGQRPDPVNSQRRSQNTPSNSGSSAIQHFPSCACISLEHHTQTNNDPKQEERWVGVGGVGGRNTPEIFPLTWDLLSVAARCFQPHKDKMNIQANTWPLPLLHDAPGWDQQNDQSCPLNIWEKRWWGYGKNSSLRGELCGEHVRNERRRVVRELLKSPMTRLKTQTPHAWRQFLENQIFLQSNNIYRDRTQGTLIFCHVHCAHSCNRTTKLLNSSRMKEWEIDGITECVPSLNPKSRIQF